MQHRPGISAIYPSETLLWLYQDDWLIVVSLSPIDCGVSVSWKAAEDAESIKDKLTDADKEQQQHSGVRVKILNLKHIPTLIKAQA